eukprot:jgi/Bigna1/88852/estExt_fgenesh1_pg.C_390082
MTLFFAANFLAVVALPASAAVDFHSGGGEAVQSQPLRKRGGFDLILPRLKEYFGWKFLVFIPLLVGMFFIEQDRMDEFAMAARVFSILFLVIQAVALIDTAYRVHYWMVDKEQAGWDIANLSVSTALYVASIISIGFMFSWFTEGGPCHVQKFILSTVLLIPIFYTAFAITSVVEHGSLFVSATITAYGVYVTFGALSSDPSETCNSFIDSSRSADTWEIVLGIAFVAISITYIAYNMGESSSNIFGKQGDEEEDEKNAVAGDSKDPESEGDNWGGGVVAKGTGLSDEELDKQKINAVIFHLLMTLASMYTCMLLTRWTSLDYSNRDGRYLSEESMWIQATSVWLIFALYSWTLAAPVMFPDRDLADNARIGLCERGLEVMEGHHITVVSTFDYQFQFELRHILTVPMIDRWFT